MKKFQDVFYPHVAMPSPFSPAFSCDQVERENLKKFENCALTNDSAPGKRRRGGREGEGRGRGGGGEASILPRGAPNKMVIKELNVDLVIKTMFLS